MRVRKKVACLILAVLQIGVIVALWIVENLTHQKAGVNHHLYYRRAQFNSTVLTPTVITVLTVLILLALVVFVFHCIRRKSTSGNWEKAFCCVAVGWMLLTVAAFYLPALRDLYSYPYIMAGLAVCDILAIVQVLLTKCPAKAC